MAESAVSSASKWIGKLVVEEIKYLNQVSENMKELQSELQWMLCFLQDADQQRYKKAVLQQWVSQIKEHAYDAEDLIDKYMVKVSEQAKGQSDKLISTQTLVRYLCILRNWSALRKVGSDMDTLTLKISKLAERLQRYGVQINKGVEDGLASQDHNQVRRTYAEDPTENFVIGRNEDIRILVTRLLSNEEQTKVIAIVGFGGLGKTTLARQVYKHDEVKGQFVSFSWAHVSKKFDVDSIMESITKDLTKGIKESDKIKEFIEHRNFEGAVKEIMNTRNCLVVIDDVWSRDDFNKLRIAFPKEEDTTGSRVMLTSRNESTVDGLNSLVFTHKPKGLKEDESLQLFEKKFGTLPVPDDEKKRELKKQMLDHCGGIPLAITALAAVLKRKQDLEEWEAIRKNVSFYLGVVEDPNKPYQKVYDVLGTSYGDLPPHLKPCFLHLANFPEDYEIKTNVLYKLWLAEGLVTLPYSSSVDKKNNLLSEEEIAEGYVNELAARSMLQVLEREEPSGRITKFQLHDLMRDVCISKATEEGFLHHVEDIYVKADQKKMVGNFIQGRELRRLAVHMDEKEDDKEDEDESSPPSESDDSPTATSTFLDYFHPLLRHKKDPTATTNIFPCLFSSSSSSQVKELISAPGLRSLIFFPIGYPLEEYDCSPLVEKISDAYPLLRVLLFKDVRNIKGIMPKKLGDMVHLRYLGLRETRITQLPSSISNLKYLQTLDLRVEEKIIIIVPNVLWKLNLLKYLYLPKSRYDELGEIEESYKIEGDLKLRLDGLTHLETLWNIDLDKTDMRGTSSLVKMKSLGWSSKMGKLVDFRSLIQSQGMDDVKLKMHSRLLKEDSRRVLSRTETEEAHIMVPQNDIGKPIGNLKLETGMLPQCLARLYFTNITFEEDPMPTLGVLQNLDSLEFTGCQQLKGLSCSKGSFPKLTYLILSGISNWEWDIEEGALPLLDELVMYDVQFATGRLPKAIRPSVLVNCHPCVNGLENQDRPCPNEGHEDDDDDENLDDDFFFFDHWAA